MLQDIRKQFNMESQTLIKHCRLAQDDVDVLRRIEVTNQNLKPQRSTGTHFTMRFLVALNFKGKWILSETRHRQ